MKTTKLRVTPNFRNILLWILKHRNHLKILNSKNFGRGTLRNFFGLEKMFFIAIFLFIDQF